MTLQYCVLFNGPPRSGKDTIANILAMDTLISLPTLRVALSQPMREAVFVLAGEIYSNDRYEQLKDKPHPLLGTTIRQAMIDLSELYVKPKYGQDFWGRSVTACIPHWTPRLVLISDLGFQAELSHMIENCGADNVVVVHIMRNGVSWEGDSRGWVEDERVQTLKYHNHEGQQEIVAHLLYHDLLLKGWEL